MMRVFVKKILAIVTHVQVMFVFLAFALMIFLSYGFMGDIERRHLLRDVKNVIANTQAYIEADLLEPETTLGVIAENARTMIMHGVTFNEVRSYLSDITEYINTDQRLMSYATRAYGIFDCFGGRFWAGKEWAVPDDYVPQERPWYLAAVEANGKVGVTEPYYNRMLEDTCITFARRIFDNEGNPLGVVCLDVMLDRIKEYAINSYVTEDSYGILMDKNFNVIAHPHPAYAGKNITLMHDGQAIQQELLEGKEISERIASDYNGNESVLFVRKLNNGWYMAILAYSKKYYQTVTDIGVILILMGAALAIILSAILLSIVQQKKKAEERTRVMLDATPLCANIWDKDFNNIDCSQEAVKLFGMANKKEYMEKFFELSPEYQPDGRLSKEKALELIKRTFDEGYCRFDWMHRKLNGEMIPCEVTLVRVKYRKDYMVCGYTRDLRELKSIMAKMREADECTQVLFDATPLSCFMFDNKHKVIECNMETVRLFGLSGKQEFLERFAEFTPEYQPSGEQSQAKLIGYLEEAFEEGFCRFDWIYQKLDGEQVSTEVSLVRVKFRGEYAVAGYIRDLRELKAMIAEMRRAEIAEESNKAKSDFLAKMSHEIRTPMNAILGITEIQLQNEALPLATKEALERIYNSGDLLLGIINDILDLSKIEAGKLELQIVQYDIASLIHDTVKLNIMRYESKPIEFILNISENVPAFLFGDELRIKQILNNLISNAFKYTQEGMINFTLSAEPDSNDKKKVTLVFTVSDTGQGMTAEQVRKLGDKYSRFNMEANRKTEGTGLGMNITRNLIQLMHGELSVESTPGMGSVFTVRLPQGCVGNVMIGKDLAENLMKLNMKSTSKMRNAQITQDFMPYGRVLVVDDVETNLYVARGLMSPYGLSIDTALSGFDAVDKIRAGASYDIVFMDHMMPRMDGMEATKIIRGLGYTKPVVALTANALAGQAEMFLNNGFDDFISKPIDIRQLNAVLNKLIRDKKPAKMVEEARQLKDTLDRASNKTAIDPQLAEFFARDAGKAARLLATLSANRFRRGDDLSAFIINVHSMKSALANVGQNRLSDVAAMLEQAGRDQNIEKILAELPAFLESLYSVINKIKPKEDETTAEDDGNEIDIPFLHEKLQALMDACAEYNKKGAKSALGDLKAKTWPRSIREHLDEISEYLLHSEFDEAAGLAGVMEQAHLTK